MLKALQIWLIASLMSTAVMSAEPQSYPAPAWQLNTPEGKTLSSQQFRGQPLIVLFWATWCPYCKKLMPGLQRLQQQYANKGLRVIMIDFNDDDDADIPGTLAQRGITLTTVLKGDAVAEQYQVHGTPTVFFIDRHGDVVYKSNNSDPNAPELTHWANQLTANVSAK